MILVIATISLNPGKRDAFIQAAQPCIAATRNEEGCLHYQLLSSTDDGDTVVFYERWTSREALDKHQASPHIKAFREVRRTEKLEAANGTTLAIFDVVD